MYILAGASAFFLIRGRLWQRCPTRLLLLWYVGESLWIYPHYLAYFNEIAGGPRHAYRHLVDSSLDWGQDLPGLKQWLDKYHLNKKEDAYLCYFGTADLDNYGVLASRLPYQCSNDPAEPGPYKGGVYCISATKLETVYDTPKGNWSALYEDTYRKLLPEMQRPQALAGTTVSPQERETRKIRVNLFEQLRFARLCAYLRQREPEEEIGYSILIYRLTDADLNEAFFGKPAELE